jgi:acyl carrier protein
MGIREQVISSIQAVVGTPLAEISDHMTFEEVGADSLDVIEIIMELEEVFKIEISSRDGERISTGTVADLIRYMEGRP